MRQIVLSAILLLCVGSARAFLIDESTSVVLDASDSADLSVKLFDPSLGHLQSVKITVTGLLTGGWQYENLNSKSSTAVTANYGLDQTLEITQGAQSYLAMAKTTTTNGLAIPVLPKWDGITDGAGTSGATIPGVNTSQTNVFVYNTAPSLAPFIGLGQTDFFVATTEGDAISASPKPAKFWLNNYSEGTATVDIQYTYTADVAAVPEPGTAKLFGLGGIGLMLAWWFRKKRAQQLAAAVQS